MQEEFSGPQFVACGVIRLTLPGAIHNVNSPLVPMQGEGDRNCPISIVPEALQPNLGWVGGAVFPVGVAVR